MFKTKAIFAMLICFLSACSFGPKVDIEPYQYVGNSNLKLTFDDQTGFFSKAHLYLGVFQHLSDCSVKHWGDIEIGSKVADHVAIPTGQVLELVALYQDTSYLMNRSKLRALRTIFIPRTDQYYEAEFDEEGGSLGFQVYHEDLGKRHEVAEVALPCSEEK